MDHLHALSLMVHHMIGITLMLEDLQDLSILDEDHLAIENHRQQDFATVIDDHAQSTMIEMDRVEEIEESHMAKEYLQGIQLMELSRRKMIVMVLSDAVVKIGIGHLMIEDHITKGIEIGVIDGDWTTWILTVQLRTDGDSMILIVLGMIGDDTTTGIVAGKTGVDQITGTDW